MKKNFSLVALMLAVICLFASCTHTHYYAEWETIKQPTCTENGEKVRYCTCGEKQSEVILAIGHNYLDGVCETCGDEKSQGNPVIPDEPACQHTETEILAAVEPTCTQTGLTEGSKCSDCGITIVEQTVVEALGHTEVVDETVEPTCTKPGLTEGKHCSVCNEVFIAQTVIEANGHSFEERRCSVCGEWDYSKGLEFVSNKDGTCYVSGIGNCTDIEIIIPDYSLENDKVTSIGVRAFSECNNILSIRLSEYVTSINWYAFEKCENLKTVILPEGLTKLGRYAFQYCTALENIVIPGSVTMMEGAAFLGCTSLVDVTITNGTTYFEPSVFNGCTALESIVIPASVTQIDSWAFKDCTSLTSILFECSEEEFANLTIDPEYAYLSNATEYYYSETKPTHVGNYWHYVDGVATKWPEYYSEGLKYTNNSDMTCSVSIGTCTDTNIIIPSISPQGWTVTDIGDSAFQGTSITSITIPNSVTTIGTWAFYGCSSLESIVIPESVTSIGYWTVGATNIKEVHITSLDAWLNIDFGNDANPLINGAELYLNGELVTELVIPDGIETINHYAFQGCSSITKITIPTDIISIGSEAFENCTSLKEVYISDINAWCNIYFSDETANPMSNGANLYIDGEIVTNVVISDFGDINAYAFYNCQSITNIEILDGVNNIGEYAFAYCKSLESIEMLDSVTSIGERAFLSCESLKSITIPGSVEIIGSETFCNCISLTSVTLLEGVYSIGNYAFQFCQSLTYIVLPKTLSSIGISAFNECYSISEVRYMGSEDDMASISIAEYNTELTNAYIRYDYTLE